MSYASKSIESVGKRSIFALGGLQNLVEFLLG